MFRIHNNDIISDIHDSGPDCNINAFLLFDSNFLSTGEELGSHIHSKSYRQLKIWILMHANNNFYSIISGNHSRDSGPIFNRLKISNNIYYNFRSTREDVRSLVS